MAIYFFYGDEEFNIELKISEMKSKLNSDFIAMNFQVFDNPDYQKLINVLRTPPMMFGNMLIVINCEKYLSSQKNFFEEEEINDIADALKNNVDTVDIVFVAKLPRNEKKSFDSRRKLYKIISQYNTQEFPSFKSYRVPEITAWIKNHARKNKDISIDNDATELLIEQIGSDLRQFDTELDKLKLIAHPQKNITRKMVEEIAISNQDLFNITDLILNNQKDKALLEFQKLTDKKHPLEILAAIQTTLRKNILIKIKHKECSLPELSKLTGLPDFVIKKTISKLKNIKVSDLIELKQNLFNAEYKIKSANSLDIVSEVEIALIR